MLDKTRGSVKSMIPNGRQEEREGRVKFPNGRQEERECGGEGEYLEYISNIMSF